jgi:hypothetical protein
MLLANERLSCVRFVSPLIGSRLVMPLALESLSCVRFVSPLIGSRLVMPWALERSRSVRFVSPLIGSRLVTPLAKERSSCARFVSPLQSGLVGAGFECHAARCLGIWPRKLAANWVMTSVAVAWIMPVLRPYWATAPDSTSVRTSTLEPFPAGSIRKDAVALPPPPSFIVSLRSDPRFATDGIEFF